MAVISHSRNWALLQSPLRFTITSVTATADELIFFKQEDEVVVPETILINVTALSPSLTNPSYKWHYSLSSDPETWVLIPNQTLSYLDVSGDTFETLYGVLSGESVNFRVTASQVGRASSQSISTIKFYDESNDTVQLILDRPSITIMCDNDGVPNLLNTNNELRVAVNGRLLKYDTAGPSTYSVSAIGINPVGSVTFTSQGNGNVFTINNLSSVTTSQLELLYTVTLTVVVRNTKGNPRGELVDGVRQDRTISYNYVKVVPATDGADAVTLDLLSDSDVVFANNSGLGYVLPGANEARLYVGGVQVPDTPPVGSPSVTYGIEIPDPQNPQNKVIVSSTTSGGLTASINSTTGVISLIGENWTNTQEYFTYVATYKNKTYKKLYTITKSVSGFDNITLDLYTESSVIFADEKGNNYTLPTQSNFAKLYKGGGVIPSGVDGPQYSTTTPSINGLTVAVDPSTGQITLEPANNGWTGDVASIVIKATYDGQEYTKIYTLTKSKKGDPTLIVNLIRNNDIVPSLPDGTAYELPAANNNRIRLYRGGAEQVSGVTYGPQTSSSNGLTAFVNSTGQITLIGNANSWNQKQAEFEFEATFEGVDYSVGYTITKSLKGTTGDKGADAITIDLYSETDVIAADEFGKNYGTLPTNYIKLYKGGTELTNAADQVTYSATSSSSGGLTASVNNTTGVITLSAPNNAWISDTAIFDFTATYNSVTYTATYSIAKSKRGSSTVFIDLQSEQHIITADSNGQNYSLPTGNFVVLYRGGDIIPDTVYGPASVTQNNLNLTVNDTTGAIALQGANWGTDREIFTITATPPGATVPFTTQYTISKTRNGATGIPAFNGALSNERYNVPVSSSGIVGVGTISNAGGVFDLKSGDTSLNSTSTFSIIGGTEGTTSWSKTQNNVKLTIQKSGAGAGTYAIEVIGGNWTTSLESFTLRGTKAGGGYIDRVYTIGKDPGTEVVSLTTTKQSFKYLSAGTLVADQGTATVTATLTGYTGTAYYEFLVDNSSQQNNTANTYTYTPKASFSDMPDQISVRVREGSTGGAVLATDTISMYGVPQGEPGQTFQGKITGVSFLRSATAPTTPTGGSFASPTAEGWSDGVPSGTLPLYMTTRLFTSDGLAPQQAAWTAPQLTSSLGQGVRALFSDTQNGTYSATATVNSQYMRIDTSTDGGATWTLGTPSKIKGEAGQGQVKGIAFTRSATVLTDAPSGGSFSSPTPTTAGWSDGVPSGTAPLYMSSRLFTSDGLAPQAASWDPPRLTSSLGTGVRAMFSDTQNGTYSATATVNSQYMRIDTSTDGGATWTLGTPSKIKGENGDPGTSIDVQYSADSTNGVNGNWSSSPTGAKWIRTGTKTPPATSFTYATGVKFVPTLGVEYTVTNGVSSYLHIKYSNDGGSTFTANDGETVGDWLGTLVNTTQADSLTPSEYTWQYVRGPQGNSIQGDRGLRSAEVQVFYDSKVASNPGLDASGVTYNFATGAIGSLPSGWSASFTLPALSVTTSENKMWAAKIRFTETDLAGNYSRTAIGPYNWLNFDGLVTFTNLSTGKDASGNTSTTMIDGGAIKANSLTIDKIQAGSGAVSAGLTFGLGQGAVFEGNPGVVVGASIATSPTSSGYGVHGGVFSSASGYGIGAIGPQAIAYKSTATGEGAGVLGLGTVGAFIRSGTVSEVYIADASNRAISARMNTVSHGEIATSTHAGKFYLIGSNGSEINTVFISKGGNIAIQATGDITATGNVVAASSDIRLKTNLEYLNKAVPKVLSLSTFTYNYNDLAKSHGLDTPERFVGLSAQEVEKVLPEAIKIAPFDRGDDGNSKTGERYITVQYERLVPLLVEAIKELSKELDSLKQKMGSS